MVHIQETNETVYIRPDKTIETIIINGREVVYVVYENGYYSFCHGLENLRKFLEGDTGARLICLDHYEDFAKICELFS